MKTEYRGHPLAFEAMASPPDAPRGPTLMLRVEGERALISADWSAADDLTGFARALVALGQGEFAGAIAGAVARAGRSLGDTERADQVAGLVDTPTPGRRAPVVDPRVAIPHLLKHTL